MTKTLEKMFWKYKKKERKHIVKILLNLLLVHNRRRVRLTRLAQNENKKINGTGKISGKCEELYTYIDI